MTLRGMDDCYLRFRFCLQLDLAILEFDGIFDCLTAVLLANLIGFLFDERRKQIKIAVYGFRQISSWLPPGRCRDARLPLWEKLRKPPS